MKEDAIMHARLNVEYLPHLLFAFFQQSLGILKNFNYNKNI